jgi:hypothetical protein
LTKDIEKYGELSMGRLQTFKVSYDVPMNKFRKFLEAMCNGTFEEAIIRVACHFLPNLEMEKQQLEKNTSEFVFSSLSTVYLKDRAGRTVAEVGSYESDPVGRLIHHSNQNLHFRAFDLNEVVKELKEQYGPNLLPTLLEYIYGNSIFDKEQRPLLEKGLAAYFDEDYITSIHLLIPQVEHTIRNLLDMAGGQIYKQGDLGGLSLRSLDTILDDEVLKGILTERIACYFKLVLTDKRGWNLRNEVCHGLKLPEEFDFKSADRVFHVLLLLAHIRETTNYCETAETEDAPESD